MRINDNQVGFAFKEEDHYLEFLIDGVKVINGGKDKEKSVYEIFWSRFAN